jgi:hypothetical protein
VVQVLYQLVNVNFALHMLVICQENVILIFVIKKQTYLVSVKLQIYYKLILMLFVVMLIIFCIVLTGWFYHDN